MRTVQGFGARVGVLALVALLAACGGGSGEEGPGDGTKTPDAAADVGGGDAAGGDTAGSGDGGPVDDGCAGKPQLAACDDGDPCTDNDRCLDGVCTGAVAKCDDGNPCTDDACQSGVGCVHTPNTKACSDGDVCTISDKCVDGACVGQPVSNTGCNDGNVCTIDDQCVEGVCKGTPNLCNDLNPCTTDSCDPTHPQAVPGVGCVHLPRTGSCDDVDACTKGDTCVDGECVGTLEIGAPCNDGNLCTGDDTCQADGSCLGTAVGCDDGNPCTTDTCAPGGGCVHTPAVGLACDDGDKCTVGDACTAQGTCAGGPKCVPGNACETSVCEPATAVCVTAPKVCDDANPCTDDGCSGATGCTFTPNTKGCDDGSLCTTGDVCAAGKCKGTPKACDGSADTVCRTNQCQPETGQCAMTDVNGKACSDEDPCTTGDTCSKGSCVGTPATCSDGDPCTLDSCDGVTGECKHVVSPDGCGVLAVDRANEYRALMKLPPLVPSEPIAVAAENHCKYYVKHSQTLYKTGFSPHNESAEYAELFTGASFADRMTYAGYTSAMGWPMFEVMAFVNDPVKSVDAWVATLYHRIPFIVPLAKHMGYGAAQQALNKCDTADFGGYNDPQPEANGKILPFPIDGMKNVPTWWDGLESPQPPLPPGEAYPSGPILTVTFGSATAWAGVSLKNSEIIDNDSGLPIVHVASDPQDDSNLCCGVIALYPVAPLDPNTTYTVLIDYSRNGTPGSFEWSFTTGSHDSTFFLP